MVNKRILIIIFFIITCLEIFGNDIDRRIGIVYLKNAAAYFLSEKYSQSEALLATVEEFFSDSSDLEYIRALIVFNRDNDLNTSIKLMKKAIKNNDWLFLEEQNCIKDLSQLLLRTKKYNELINLIEDNISIGYNDNDLMYIYLLALKYNNSIKFTERLQESLKIYPKDYRFAEIFLENNLSFAREIINGKYYYTNKDGAIKVFLKAALMLPDEIERKNALEKYFSLAGNDPRATIEYYKITGINTEEELNNLLKEDLFKDPDNVYNLKKILGREKLRNIFEKYCNAYSGNIYYDLNNDNYNEELYIYENGRPLGISIDNNQDGIIEYMIVFEDALPSEIIITEKNFIRIVYNGYPTVRELSFSTGEERVVYDLLQDRVFLNSFLINKENNKIIINYNNIEKLINDKEMLLNNSLKVSTYKKGNKPNSIDSLKKELEKHTESYSTLKVYDKIMGNYIYQNNDYIKTMGFADIDFDNLIDLREEYKDGKITSIEVDDNKNGIYNYKLLIQDEGNISLWDFNEDGIYDCKQYLVDNVMISEYSSLLDGNFDIIERQE